MHPLHDDNENTVILVVEARRHGFVPEPQRIFACHLAGATDLSDVMGIIKNDDVASFAGNHAALGSGDAMTAAQIVESGFLVLIRAQFETMPP